MAGGQWPHQASLTAPHLRRGLLRAGQQRSARRKRLREPPGLGKAGAGGERVSSTAGLSPQRRAQRPRSSPFPPLELFGAVIALFLSAVLAESFLLARAPRRRPIAEGARGAPAIFGASCAAAAGRAGLSDPAA